MSAADIVAVLLIPAEGDPGGLLAPGRCGSEPPSIGCGPAYEPGRPGGEPEHALPLWWDGALVPEGWDRARRVFTGHPDCRSPALDYIAVRTHPTLAEVLTLAHGFADADLARVVRLARVDGRLAEVEP